MKIDTKLEWKRRGRKIYSDSLHDTKENEFRYKPIGICNIARRLLAHEMKMIIKQ